VRVVCEKLFSLHASCSSTRSCSPSPLFDPLPQLRSTSPRSHSTFLGQEAVLVELVLREMVLLEVAPRETVLREATILQNMFRLLERHIPKTLPLFFPHVLRTMITQAGPSVKDQ